LATKADAKPSAKPAMSSPDKKQVKKTLGDKPTIKDTKAKTGMTAPFKSVAKDQVKARQHTSQQKVVKKAS
jgi:hypothetical protein